MLPEVAGDFGLAFRLQYNGDVSTATSDQADAQRDACPDGQVITIRFVRWLRDQCAFPHVDELRRQLTRDINQTRWLGDRGLLESNGPEYDRRAIG